jgi:hypothetical protein
MATAWAHAILSKGASMVVEEDATAVTKFGFVRFITEGLKVINCLFVGNEEFIHRTAEGQNLSAQRAGYFFSCFFSWPPF